MKRRLMVIASALVASFALMTSTAFAYTGVVTSFNWTNAPLTGCSGCVTSGDIVGAWQLMLWGDGFGNECDKTSTLYSGIDDSFGPLTTKETRAWQSWMGLSSDGVVGSQSWGKVRSRLQLTGQSGYWYQYRYPGGVRAVSYLWDTQWIYNGATGQSTPAWTWHDPIGSTDGGDPPMWWYDRTIYTC